jgi:hypothetical protein
MNKLRYRAHLRHRGTFLSGCIGAASCQIIPPAQKEVETEKAPAGIAKAIAVERRVEENEETFHVSL